MEKDSYFQKIFAEICLGYSEILWKDSKVYIKHLSNLDSIELDSFYDNLLNKAKLSGIQTYEDKIKWLSDNKIWDINKDIEIKQQIEYVDSLKQTHEKLVFKTQKLEVERTLKEELIKLERLTDEKEDLVGTTAEKIANQKIQFYSIYLSFFKDIDLKDKFFSIKDIDDLDDDNSYQLLKIYINTIDRFGIQSMKKIAISNYFTNIFYICSDNLQSFFGKPVYLLTNYQLNLLSYGIYFKNIFMANSDLPEEIRYNPEKIEEFIKKSRGLKDMLSKIDPSSKSVGIIASNEDFKEMGLQRDNSTMKTNVTIT